MAPATTPDGREIVATRADASRMASPPLLVLDAVEEFMDRHGLGAGPLQCRRIGDGQSNVTFQVRRGHEMFVLRRGPRPPLPKSTHDMIREARIQQLVRRQGMPVPEILAICEDLAVLGVPFYIMSYVQGVVITDTVPPALSSLDQRRETGAAVVDTLVRLHQLDVTSGDLASFGRPAGYLQRQLERFSSLWEINTTRSLPDVEKIGAWLMENIPASQAASVIHGDYRTGNLMFALGSRTRVASVLDWEMATIGDPLADLGYLTATYAESGSISTPLELTPVTRLPGYPSRAELVCRYRDQTGLDTVALPWYQALALWKASIFCEAIYTRWLRGERPEDTQFGPTLEVGVPRLLEAAGQFAGVSPAAAAVRASA